MYTGSLTDFVQWSLEKLLLFLVLGWVIFRPSLCFILVSDLARISIPFASREACG